MTVIKSYQLYNIIRLWLMCENPEGVAAAPHPLSVAHDEREHYHLH